MTNRRLHFPHFCAPFPFALLFVICTREVRAQAKGWRSYSDTTLGYAFDYPPDYEIRKERFSVYLERADSSTEFFIEDWTRPVKQGMQWDFEKLAAERAIGECQADSPEHSESCTLHDTQGAANAHGLHVIAVTRNHLDSDHPGASRVLAPLYVADLSGAGTFALLMVAPRANTIGVAPEVLRAIITTIRKVGK